MGENGWVYRGRMLPADQGPYPCATVQAGTRAGAQRFVRLNRAADDLVSQPASVLLLWDGERRRSGLRPCPVDHPHRGPVRTNATGHDVTLGPFCCDHGITVSTLSPSGHNHDGRRCPVARDGETIVIDLDGEPVP